MKKDFLYTKPFVLGIIDDSSTADWDSWLLDDSRERMEERVRSLPLPELLMELEIIFQEGEPNYVELLGLFGSNIVKKVHGAAVVYSVEKVLRANNDIHGVEIEIDDKDRTIKRLTITAYRAQLNASSISVRDKTITLQGCIHEN